MNEDKRDRVLVVSVPHLYENVGRGVLRGGHLELLDDIEVAGFVDADGGDRRGEGHARGRGDSEGPREA